MQSVHHKQSKRTWYNPRIVLWFKKNFVMQALTSFILFLILQIYQMVGNLGWAIVIFTVLVRSALFPLSLKQLQTQKKIKEIQPELDKLKKKHNGTKQEFQKKQMELYQKYNVNPLAGCLPQLVQIALLIILYRVLINFLGQTEINGIDINSTFYWLDLSKPDTTFVLPIVAAGSQLVLSLMISPGGEIRDIVPNQSKSKKIKKANEKEEDVAEMASSMQKQMIFIMPVMTGMIALRFPSGVALYWVMTTLFSIFQQFIVSGPGGLKTYFERITKIGQIKS